LRQFCGDDYMTKCGNVPPATSQALQCLQSHAADLSPNCRGALALFSPSGAPSAPVGTAAPAAASAAPAVAPAAAPSAHPASPAVVAKPAATATTTIVVTQPTPQQRDAIKQSCQSDFMARCPGVQPGGADALHCLQRNSAQLSPNCKSAVAAVSGGAPAAATAAAAPAAPAPAAAPNAQQQAAIKAACGRDFMSNCRGVTPGGPEAFACLQRNASRLSPDCKTALAAVASGTTPPAAAAAAAPPPPPPGPFPLRRAIRERMMSQ
jgi:hypothetical protein